MKNNKVYFTHFIRCYSLSVIPQGRKQHGYSWKWLCCHSGSKFSLFYIIPWISSAEDFLSCSSSVTFFIYMQHVSMFNIINKWISSEGKDFLTLQFLQCKLTLEASLTFEWLQRFLGLDRERFVSVLMEYRQFLWSKVLSEQWAWLDASSGDRPAVLGSGYKTQLCWKTSASRGNCAVYTCVVSYLFEELIHEVVPVDLHHLLIVVAVLGLQTDRK